MKKMIIALIASCMFAQFSFAQGSANMTTTNTMDISSEKTKGLEVGLVYSNLTDANMRFEGTVYDNLGNSYRIDQTSKGGTHLGIAGINVNYKERYAQNLLGYYFGGAIMQRLNKSESEQSINLFKGQVGLTLTPVDHFSLGGDLNISYFDIKDNNSDLKYLPGVGLDLVLEFYAANTSIQVGYQALGMNAESKSGRDDLKLSGFVSGIIAQVSYLF